MTLNSPKLPSTPSSPQLPGAAPLSAPAAKPSDVPRRTVDVRPDARPQQQATFTPAVSPLTATADPSLRRLIVGRDISLSGEIGSCDILVVEGTVEAKLRDGHSIEVAESGLFKGSVEIDDADIGGRFEGDINVKGRLIVRSSGRITGSISYGELTVEPGGQLIGEIKVHDIQAPRITLTAPATEVEPV